jgi:mannosyl-oligosaccharide glucosidase
MQFIQMVFQGSFDFDIIYHSEETPGALTTSESITAGLDTLYASFPTRVDKAFPRANIFRHSQYAYIAQSILSQLMGGLGFFYGNAKEDRSNASEYQELDTSFWEKAAEARGRASITTTKPMTLLSHTPSRPVYPRGFLWDEGFHLLPIIEWDFDLAVSVIRSWMNLMDDEGWIGREQILGAEARNKVPAKFQVQYPHYANPPTLLLLLPNLLSKITKASAYNGNPSKYLSSREKGKSLLTELYPLFARHAAWFRRTQVGNFTSQYPRPEGVVPGEGYRWRGTSPGSCLTSGLDDFPRANPPHPGELHVDALAWVAASAMSLQAVASYLSLTSDAAMYRDHASAATHSLDVLHWSAEQGAYCDATISTENTYQHVCHIGYITLMPLLLGLLGPTHPNLPGLLDLMSSSDKLLSPYGIRSLSAQDDLYYTGSAYWRGPVWINLNVLAVLRLWELGQHEGPQMERARSLAIDLRDRVVILSSMSGVGQASFGSSTAIKTGRGHTVIRLLVGRLA